MCRMYVDDEPGNGVCGLSLEGWSLGGQAVAEEVIGALIQWELLTTRSPPTHRSTRASGHNKGCYLKGKKRVLGFYTIMANKTVKTQL